MRAFLGKQKAWVGALVSAISTLAISLKAEVDSIGASASLLDLSTSAWLAVIIAMTATATVTGGAIYAQDNKAEPRRDRNPDLSR